MLRLEAIYRKVWNSFSLFFFNRLLIRAGSWFWSRVAPPARLWPGSWLTGQLLLASYPSNPQPKTDYHQRFSTFGMKLVVTSDFMDLGPIYVPNQFDQRVTGLMAWCFGWLRLQTSLTEALLNTGSAPKHSVNSCWRNEGMSGWQTTSQLCQRCQFDCVQTPSVKNSAVLVGPLHSSQSLQSERNLPPPYEDPGYVLWSVKGGKNTNCQA